MSGQTRGYGAGACYKALPCFHICFRREITFKSSSGVSFGRFPRLPRPNEMISFPSFPWLCLNASVITVLFNVLQTLYSDTIPEDALPGKLVVQVSATDADIRSNAEITYTLFGSGAEKFRLNPDTGKNGVRD